MKAKFHVGIILVALIFFPATGVQAQSPTTVLNRMIDMLRNNTVQTNFGLVIKEPGSGNQHKTGGTFLMKGNKFELTTDDMLVYFDGKTQWAYMPDINEVSISYPTEKELAETNPLALLNSYKDKSSLKYINNTTAKNAYTVELTPNKNTSDIKIIQVVITKVDYYPQSVQFVDKNGTISTLTLTKFQTGVHTTNKNFTFNTSVYKDIEINDLR